MSEVNLIPVHVRGDIEVYEVPLARVPVAGELIQLKVNNWLYKYRVVQVQHEAMTSSVVATVFVRKYSDSVRELLFSILHNFKY